MHSNSDLLAEYRIPKTERRGSVDILLGRPIKQPRTPRKIREKPSNLVSNASQVQRTSLLVRKSPISMKDKKGRTNTPTVDSADRLRPRMDPSLTRIVSQSYETRPSDVTKVI